MKDLSPGFIVSGYCGLTYRTLLRVANKVMQIMALDLKGEGIIASMVHPGWVKTDMGGPDAPVTVEDAVTGVLWAVDLPDDGPTGGFFRDGRPVAW